MSTNPYALLAQKKFKGDPSKLKKAPEPVAAKPKINQPAKKADSAHSTPVPSEKKREAKVISLKEEPVAQVQKQDDPAPPTKKEREVKDRHEDRSAKGDRERKEGQGVGGWETDWKSKVQEGEDAARDALTEENADKEDPVSPNTADKEKEKKEEEKPRMTVEEFQKLKRKAPESNFTVRTVDTTTLKGLVQASKNEENFFQVKKPAPKPSPKPAPKSAQPAKKVEEKKEEEKKEENKVDPQELIRFKYKTQQSSRGRGRGRSDENEVEGEGGRGRGRGKGRGRIQEESKEAESGSQFTLNQNDFPPMS